jgi:predicted branched-subunit amino acid permease
MLTKDSFKSGVLHSYPICIAFTFMYSALGMLGHAKGLSLSKLVVMSATIFAVPLQALVINNQELTIVTTVINSFILNFKFLLMSSVLIPLWHRKALTIPSLHFICNSTYMVCSIEKEVKEPWSFYIGVSLPSYVSAIVATIFGYMLWDIGSNYQSFLQALAHIVLPIHFICLTMKRKKEMFVIAATVLGLVMTPVLLPVIGNQLTIVAWLIFAGILIMIEEKVCGKLSLQPA